MANVTFRFIQSEPTICVGDEFTVQAVVDADTAVNVVDGALRYDSSHVEPIGLTYGDSFVQFWVDTPSFDGEAGSIGYTGGLPTPGYHGSGGSLMTVTYRAVAPGRTGFSHDKDTVALLDDGEATEARVSTESLVAEIHAEDDALCVERQPVTIGATDTEPPLPFTIDITRTENAFNGDYFASYFTTDTESGVAYYEVMEQGQFRTMSWIRSDSPYRLSIQSGNVSLTVRAVDNAGNIRTETASASLEGTPRSQLGSDTILLILAGALAVLVLWHCWHQRDRRE